MRTKWVLILAAVLGLAGTAWGATWYVDAAIPSGGNGTSWAEAKKTLGAALALSIADGDEVWIDDGTAASPAVYNEGGICQIGATCSQKSITIKKVDKDSDGGSVTIQPSGGSPFAAIGPTALCGYAAGKTITFEDVTIKSTAGTIAIYYDGITSDGGPNLQFTRCTIQTGGDNSRLVHIDEASANSTVAFTDCTFDGSNLAASNGKNPFYIAKSLKALKIVGGSITLGNAAGQRYFYAEAGATLGQLLLDDVNITANRTSAQPFASCDATGYVSSLVVRNCTVTASTLGLVFYQGYSRSLFYNNDVTVNCTSSTKGPALQVGADGTTAAANNGPVVFRNNRVRFTGGYYSHGVLIGRGCDNSEMAYNVVESSDWPFTIKGDYAVAHHNYGAGQNQGFYVRKASYAKILNNTVMATGDGAGGIQFDDGTTGAYNVNDCPQNCIVTENLFYINATSGAGFVYSEEATADRGLILNRNVVYIANAATMNYWITAASDNSATDVISADRAAAASAASTRGLLAIAGIDESINFALDVVTTSDPIVSVDGTSSAFGRLKVGSDAKPTAARLWNPIGAWGKENSGKRIGPLYRDTE